MSLSKDMQKMISFKRDQWSKESQLSFCKLAKMQGVEFTNITYPTGVKFVKAEVAGYHKTEVPLHTAKQLRANGFMVVC